MFSKNNVFNDIVSNKQNKLLFVLIVFFIILLFIDLPKNNYLSPDEERYSEIPREMLVSKDFITPHLNGANYFEKPPLFYWINALSISILGENGNAVRFPTRLAAFGIALVLFFNISKIISLNAGLWSALIFLSNALVFGLGRTNIIDGMLSFALTVAFFLLCSILNERIENRRSVLKEVALGVFLAIAVLLKGLIGIVFPCLVGFIWIVIMGRRKLIYSIVFSWVIVSFLVVVMPWFVLVEKNNPGFSKIFFIYEHFSRFSTNSHHRPGSIFYFLVTFLLGFLPWTSSFISSVKNSFIFSKKYWQKNSNILFFYAWFFSILIFFSFSHSKLIPYILPAFPAAAVIVAIWISEQQRKVDIPLKLQSMFLIVLTPVLIGVSLISNEIGSYIARNNLFNIFFIISVIASLTLVIKWKNLQHLLLGQTFFWVIVYIFLVFAQPNILRERSDYDLALAAARISSDQIVLYKCYSQSFPWMLKKTIPLVEAKGELDSDNKKPKDIFWNENIFWKYWDSKEKVLAVVPIRDVHNFYIRAKTKFIFVSKNKRYLLISNFNVPNNNSNK